ncbi:MAG: AI-2E family transporter [bacterium]
MILFKDKTEREVFLRFIFFIAVVILCFIVVFNIPGMLWQALLSIVAAYLFYPLINKMEKWGIARWFSILLVYLLVGIGVFVIYQTSYTGIITQFDNLSAESPKIFSLIVEKVRALELKYSKNYVFLNDIMFVKKLELYGTDFAQSIVKAVPKLISSTITFLILVPFYTFFLLKDGAIIKKWILEMLPDRYLETGVTVLYNINKQMSGFIQARLLEAGVLGIVVYIGLLILGIKYSLLLALVAAVMNLVPYLGIILGSAPGVAVAYFYGDTSALVWYTILVYTIAQLIDMVVVIPLVFSKRVNIHPMVVVILLIIGFELMGIVGLILAVPFFCILKVLFTAVSERITVVK